ncbi:MAG: HNH endonuclease [Salinarimonadaceae bacterium]|nr:MAG: HNH endonuclease [Salinarimonadaceae bacterium]
MADWPYNTSQWQRLRKAKLSASPVCHPCSLRGRAVPANTVDHVKAIASGGDPFPPLDQLMSMCPSCHAVKTAAVDKPGGDGVRFRGTGFDGLPVDPSHPFFGGDTPV